MHYGQQRRYFHKFTCFPFTRENSNSIQKYNKIQIMWRHCDIVHVFTQTQINHYWGHLLKNEYIFGKFYQ